MKHALLLSLAFVALAPMAHAEQLVTFATVTALSTSAEQFVPPFAGTTQASNSITAGVVPIAATLGSFLVRFPTAPGTGSSYTATFMHNQASTTDSCTVQDTNTECAISFTGIILQPGDTLVLAITPFNTPAASMMGASVAAYPVNKGDIWTAARQSNSFSGTTEQFTIVNGANAQTLQAVGAEASTTQMVPVAGTFDRLYFQLSGSVGVGNTQSIELRQNLASTTLTAGVVNPGTGATDLVDSVIVAAQDLIDYAAWPTVTPTVRNSGTSMRFRATDPTISNAFFGSSLPTNDAVATNEFMIISGDRSRTPTESNAQIPLAIPMNFTTMVFNDASPTGGAIRKAALRLNGVTTSMGCTLSGGSINTTQTCNATGNVRGQYGDLVDTIDIPTGNPVTGFPIVSYAGTTPHGSLTVNKSVTIKGSLTIQ